MTVFCLSVVEMIIWHFVSQLIRRQLSEGYKMSPLSVVILTLSAITVPFLHEDDDDDMVLYLDRVLTPPPPPNKGNLHPIHHSLVSIHSFSLISYVFSSSGWLMQDRLFIGSPVYERTLSLWNPLPLPWHFSNQTPTIGFMLVHRNHYYSCSVLHLIPMSWNKPKQNFV